MERKSKFNLMLNNVIQEMQANEKSNALYINPENYDKMGAFHKNMIYLFGRMMDLVKDDQTINYHEFVAVMEKLIGHKPDIEKQYITGLFFPKTIVHATFLNPL
jgi:hypothetical protein